MRSLNRRLAFYAALMVLWLCCAEAVSFFAGRFLQSKWMMYRDPQPVVATRTKDFSYDDYLAARDPNLGWPQPAQIGKGGFEANGAQSSPVNERLGQPVPAISLYGDSYTQARNVPPDKGWDARLSQKLSLRVDNFGLGGYGTDQAYLRFLTNRSDRAHIVILGHLSEDILRNLTRYRDFQTYARWYAFKPRFDIATDGQLELIPMPRLTRIEYRRFLAIEEPALILDHENFHPNGPTGAVRLSFPFSLAVLENTRYWRFSTAVRSIGKGVREPDYKQFYDPDHPFGGLQITHQIMRSFHDEALRLGKLALVLLFPSPISLEYRRETGTPTYQPLVDLLASDGIAFLDFGESLSSYMEGRSVEKAYVAHHFTEEIHERVAVEVAAYLLRNGWLNEQTAREARQQESIPEVRARK